MALRHVIIEGDEILRKHCREVDQVTDRTRMILDDMVETMREAGGVGLAAPQVGIMRRMFVAQPDPEQECVYYLINPEILERSGTQVNEEGCLSVPGYQGTVERPEQITMKALDRNGRKQVYEFDGFAAVVMCHELDHLEGILFTDKAIEVYEVKEAADAGDEDKL